MMQSSIAPKMKLSIRVTTRLLSSESPRRTTTSSPPPDSGFKISRNELYRRLSGVALTGQNMTHLLQQLTRNGFKLENADLVFCLKRLRKYGRSNHCLEILDWVDKYSSDYSHFALHLDLTCKLKGIDEAERYFSYLPPHAKTYFMYTTLLNCYCSKKMVVKALALFRKMEEMNLRLNSLVFCNLMGLFMKVDQPEKVPPLVQEMKNMNIPLCDSSYNIWLQSYGRLKDLAGIERVMVEVEEHEFLENGWTIYRSLATAYMNVGQSQKATSALNKLEEVLDFSNYFDRTAYHNLISLYARSGNEESVFRVWGKLNAKSKECHNQSYLIMLQALSKLENVECLKKLLEEWKSRYRSYDVRLPCVVIGAYLRYEMIEGAEQLLEDAMVRKARQNVWLAHVSFMDYYLRKQQTDPALRHMEAAYSDGWLPCVEKLSPFFEIFKQKKDIHGTEKLCNMLKDVQALDSEAYLWLLQTYVAAGKELTGMRQRMEEDGITIGSEHEELISAAGIDYYGG